MFFYKKRTKKALVTMSSIVVLTALMVESEVKAETADEDIQVVEIEKNVNSEDETLLVDEVFEDSFEVTGVSEYPNRIVQIIKSEELLYTSKTDEAGNFLIEVEPFIVDSEITVQIIELVTKEIEEEQPKDESTSIDEEVNEFEEHLLAKKEVTVLTKVVEELPLKEVELPEESKEEALPPVSIEEDLVEELPVKEPVEKNEVTQKSKATILKEKKPLGKSYHYVKSGDTLNSIAKAYNTTAAKISEWNDLKNANIIRPGQLLSIDGFNDYHNISKETRTFSTTEEFISFLVPGALEAAEKYNIYASIILAQAIHESDHGKSDLATVGNNLFGIKGSFNGNTINMLTWEEVNGEVVWVVEPFRLYPTYADSLKDNADKIRNGVTWDRAYYRGAWVENTASHMDATEWLTGRYATDSLYGTKLNNTIARYNLTQYDKHITITDPIIQQSNLKRSAKITGKSYTIFQQPKGAANGNALYNTNDYLNKTAVINKEKVNSQGTWYHISVDGKDLGYVLAGAVSNLTYEIISEYNANYSAYITEDWSINSKPWGVTGFQKLSSGKSYKNQPVKVVKEAVTDRGTYALLTTKYGETIGWIDKTGIEKTDEILATNDVRYAGIIAEPWSINTEPFNTGEAKPVENYEKYHGAVVEVKQEKETIWGTYAEVLVGGKSIGWIDAAAIAKYQVLSEKQVSYQAVIKEPWSINSQPWGITGYQPIKNYLSYLNQRVDVVREQATQRGTFALLKVNGKELGWIDKDALSTYYNVLSTTDISYVAEVTKPWSINTQPWGTYGATLVSNDSKFVGKQVEVTQEKVTERSTYALITVDGKRLGWIDKTGIDEMKVSVDREVDYMAKVVQPWSINTKPWGVAGFELVSSGSAYRGTDVHIVREQVTQRGTYSLLYVNGKELGWIDKGALEVYPGVISTTDTNYIANIRKPWSINTAPWGTYGSEYVASGAAYIGKQVEVVQEKVTERSTYALLKIDGSELGWIDKTGIEELVVSKTRDVNYSATIHQPWSINTQPWGVNGYEYVSSGSEYMGQQVEVIQEKDTQRSTYSLIRFNGETIGWIDKDALETFYLVQSTTDISYMAEITHPWSINTQPWGTYGSEEGVVNTFVGKVVEVIQEKTTERSTYALVVLDGETLGWIDVTGVSPYTVLSTKNVNYTAEIIKPWSINTQPWGTLQYEAVDTTGSYVGKKVKIIQEKTTRRGTYGLVQYQNDNIGWIDLSGVK